MRRGDKSDLTSGKFSPLIQSNVGPNPTVVAPNNNAGVVSNVATANIQPSSAPTSQTDNETGSKDYNTIKFSPQFAETHRILTLSDEEYLQTNLAKMMEWYENTNPNSCSGDFGNQLIANWRSKKETYCTPNLPGVISQSSIECYLVHQTRHHGSGDNLCLMHNVSVQLGMFGDP